MTNSRSSPEPEGGRIASARALLREGKNDVAIEILSAERATSDSALIHLADAYFQKRDWARALSCTREAIARQVDLEYNQRVEIKILSNAKRFEEALQLVVQYESRYGGHLEVLVTKKIASYFLGRLLDAQRYGQNVIHLKAMISEKFALPQVKLRPNRGTKKIIAYSLWGNRQCYNLGAVINAELIAETFPGWKARFYVSSSISDQIIGGLCKRKAEVVLADKEFPDIPPYMWRFLVMNDPETRFFLCRDADCRLSAEEFQLVGEWLGSGKQFHVCRDHILHDDLILAGLWGGVGTADLDMRKLVSEFFESKPSNRYGADQRFLAKVIWPQIKRSVLVHDRYYWTPGVTSHKHGFNVEFGASHMNLSVVRREAQRLGILAN